MRHAADLLEDEAKAICSCHTIDGMWGDSEGDIDARAAYDDMMRTAQELRELCSG